MASLGGARQKEVMLVNPKKKRRKAKKGKRRAARKGTTKKKRKGGGHRKAARRRTSRRRKSARRNPAMDVGGTAISEGMGLVSALVNQPLAHLLNKKLVEKGHTKSAKVARVLAPAALGFGGGLLLGKLHPAVGKGFAGGAGAVAGMHGMAVVADLTSKEGAPPAVLQKAGFTQLGAADDYFVRDGHMWKKLPEGGEQLMFGVGATRVEFEDDDGGITEATGLGNVPGGALVMMPDRTMQLIPGLTLDGLQPATELDGLQPATELSGLQEATELAGADDEEDGGGDYEDSGGYGM